MTDYPSYNFFSALFWKTRNLDEILPEQKDLESIEKQKIFAEQICPKILKKNWCKMTEF